MNRRSLVKTVIATTIFAGTVPLIASERTKTPQDFTGPFYPRGPKNHTNDLIKGNPRFDVLKLSGRVITPTETPLEGALVDIWHADPKGRYKHPRGHDQDELLDEFLYWGESLVDSDGGFTFRTYVPGSYSARPAQHIHYKVWLNEREVLTSQIYFEELGGARGLARSSEAAALQTVNLINEERQAYRASIDIVIGD